MAAKTEVKKETVNVTKALTDGQKDLIGKIETLEEENSKLININKELIEKGVTKDSEIERLSSSASAQIDTTRTALLLALAPQINLPHARSEAQRLLVAVDDIMEVWGI